MFEKNEWRSHEWKDAIEPHTNPLKSLGFFVGGVGAGFVTAVVIAPPVGVIVGASLIGWASWIEWRLGGVEDSVLEDELIAPFINRKSDFHNYLNGVGKDRVKAEIEEAMEKGLEIAPFATNWYNANQKGEPIFSDKAPLVQLKEEQELKERKSQANAGEEESPSVPSEDENPVPFTEEEPPAIAIGKDEDEENPFWEIPFSQLVILAGMQGSGKTTTLATIVEQKLKQQAFVLLLDPFYAAGKHFGLPVVGRDPENKFADISSAIDWFCATVEGRMIKQAKYENYDPVSDDVHICLVIDEFTNLSNSLDPEILARLWDNSLTTLRRLNLSVILATHNLRIPGLGGKKAVASKMEAIENQSVQFKLKTKNNKNRQPGESPKIPAGKAEVKKEGDKDFIEVDVPEDFRPTNLNFDFRFLTEKDKHPNWREEVGLDG